MGLLGFPLSAALEQMLARLLNSAVAQARPHPWACLDPLPLGDTSLQMGEGRAAELLRQLP